MNNDLMSFQFCAERLGKSAFAAGDESDARRGWLGVGR